MLAIRLLSLQLRQERRLKLPVMLESESLMLVSKTLLQNFDDAGFFFQLSGKFHIQNICLKASLEAQLLFYEQFRFQIFSKATFSLSLMDSRHIL